MNTLKKHIDYYKNNPKGLWFKRKLYGWGWTPVKWEGWFAIIAWAICFSFLVLNMNPADLLKDFILIFASFALLIFICYAKGEKPKWQWGLKSVK